MFVHVLYRDVDCVLERHELLQPIMDTLWTHSQRFELHLGQASQIHSTYITLRQQVQTTGDWTQNQMIGDPGGWGARRDTVNKGCGQWDWGRRAVSGEDVVLIYSFRSDENHNLLNLFTSIRCLQKGLPQRCRSYKRSTTSESANSTVRTQGEED